MTTPQEATNRELTPGVELVAEADLPCDFTTFVAQRTGISHAGAERLIERWLTLYSPRQKPFRAERFLRGSQSASRGLESCAR